MKKMIFSSLLFLAFAAQANTNYKLDPSHSNVGFSVKHLMVSKVRGSFTKFDGTFVFNEKKNEVSKIDVKIDPASVNTNDKKRDEHLASPDFFDVAKNPEMRFQVSKPFTVKPNEPTKVTGDLTMRGVTKPVTLNVVYAGAMKDAWGNDKVGFTLTGEINRKDWGVNWNKALDKGGVTVSDEVMIEIEGQGQKVK